MRTVKPELAAFDADGGDFAEEEPDPAAPAPLRVTCPECDRPIALAGPGRPMPQHAVCPTPWDPFGLTVCAGSGRAVREAGAAPSSSVDGAEAGAALAVLPESLDWRLQPFSHAAWLRQAA
ncbi:hypothetical protein RM780_21050 [Streptomyces sp. DSM 44917]|uniref:Uncharacterized protein n=1 Tax=Streptomyces boetiae TaxID=3075541 RepID=A0ABU2LE25_9ACTN|nr:hypothetical protein [Streptomyces sp. DSM 44917]MDT0309428.1 hypothetical protein [Streptomyces sp. DSM 44917]